MSALLLLYWRVFITAGGMGGVPNIIFSQISYNCTNCSPFFLEIGTNECSPMFGPAVLIYLWCSNEHYFSTWDH